AVVLEERERRGFALYRPSGGHFLLNLGRRSLADRDSLSVSLRGLCAARSSGQQAPGRRASAPLAVVAPVTVTSPAHDCPRRVGGRPVKSRRRFITDFLIALIPLGATASAQEYKAQQTTGQRHRVGLLNGASERQVETVFREGLRAFGYVEGTNIVID